MSIEVQNRVAFAQNKYSGFQLESLELFEHPVLGTIRYDFSEQENHGFLNYFTVVIGANGTGKSILLSLITQICRQIESPIGDGDRIFDFTFGFIFRYQHEGVHAEFVHKKGDESKKRGGWKSLATNRVTKKQLQRPYPLPTVYIAQSQVITDKFPFIRKVELEKTRYRYLGIKSEPQSASTQRYIRRSLDYIAAEQNRENFLTNLKLLLDEFISSYIDPYIVYYTRSTKVFFNGDISPNTLVSHFGDMRKRFNESGKRPPNALAYFEKLAEKEPHTLEAISIFCNTRTSLRLDKIDRSPSRGISYNISSPSDFILFQNEYPLLEHLRNLNMVHSPEFEFNPTSGDNNDPNERYSILESSSGEVHLITTFIGLLALLRPNSLVLIDEPENSLHPNWQMRFIHFLNKLLSGSGYNGTHIVIATHSHFLVSDLPGNSSRIVALTRDKDRKLDVLGMPRNMDTYGWSAEDVLFRVFKVKSARNYYFQSTVAELLNLLYIKSDNISRIQELLGELKGLNISKNDPLQELILETESYLKK